MKLLTRINFYFFSLSFLFVISCKEVTEYKEKNKINFERYDSIKNIVTNNKKNLVFSSIKDIQNNSYKTIKIGKQVWMAQNLRVTCLNDSSKIYNFSSKNTTKKNAIQTLYSTDFTEDSLKIFGRLYNWYAVSTNKLCPKGWRVPSNQDWDSLIVYLENNYFGYNGNTKEIAKSLASDNLWRYGDVPGFIGNEPQNNNSSGFNAYPSGVILENGDVKFKGEYSSWWSIDNASETQGFYYFLFYDYTILSRNSQLKTMGMSVRCIKE